MSEEQAERVELYGFVTDDVEGVRGQVEAALGVTFSLHESAQIGPYYFAPFCSPHAELTLRPNLDASADEDADEEDALAEPDFPDFGVLLYVEWKTTGHSCRARVKKLEPDAQLLLVEE